MARLELTIKRYIGDSRERKPHPGDVQTDGSVIKAADLPSGSSFLEEDTGRVARWTGFNWAYPPESDDELAVLRLILAELRALRAERLTGLPQEAQI